MASQDTDDWRKAELDGSIAAYESYLHMHPDGQYVVQAQMAIANLVDRARVVNAVRADRNAFSPQELQRYVDSQVIAWNDLQDSYTADEIDAIRQFEGVIPLPDGFAPNKLQRDTTEVYFWGTPSSGKTCALGSLLSASYTYGILTKRPCQGRQYMDRLCNTFMHDGFCTLPQGTPDYSIQEMVFTLRDGQQREHPLACIDLAGEVFRALYRRQNHIVEENYTQEQALNHTLSYLADKSNRKIHFFIIAYGEHEKEWDGLRMHDYLDSAMDYLRDNKVIRRGTNAIYILVTKCDRMTCQPKDRQEYAARYVKQYMPALSNALAQICSQSGVLDFDILPFSIGDVFAQKLCYFERTNNNAVLKKLISMSGYISKGFW